jgi:hypothetical protein
LKKKSNQFFFVVPLGDEDRFRIREYEVDITHVTKKNEEWWIKLFESQGFELLKFSYSLGQSNKNGLINIHMEMDFFSYQNRRLFNYENIRDWMCRVIGSKLHKTLT